MREIESVRYVGRGRRIAGKPPFMMGALIRRDDKAPTYGFDENGEFVAPLAEIKTWLEDWPNEWHIEYVKPPEPAKAPEPVREEPSVEPASPFYAPKTRRGRKASGD